MGPIAVMVYLNMQDDVSRWNTQIVSAEPDTSFEQRFRPNSATTRSMKRP